MNIPKRIALFGDSILKGIQTNPQNKRFHIDNHIDYDLIEKKHSLEILNYAKFGNTVTKGFSSISKRLSNNTLLCDAIIMDFGGNDCDYDWKAISEAPDEIHLPRTPIDVFINTYKMIIAKLNENGIRPILTTLPPLEPQKFFDWFCGGLNKEAVLDWLGSINTIYRTQENYSRAVEKIAAETNTPIIDIRGAFLRHKRADKFICDDGTHPNTEGQKLISGALMEFIDNLKVSERCEQ
jgi:lysophospholipase L1-like esterase